MKKKNSKKQRKTQDDYIDYIGETWCARSTRKKIKAMIEFMAK